MEIRVPESVPEQLLDTLERDVFNYKRNLIGDTRFLNEEEKKSIDHISKELYRVQAELQSVAHERVVVDVLSRPVLTEIEHHRGLRIQASKEAYLQRRSGVEPSSSSSGRSSGKATNASPEDPIYIPPYVPAFMKEAKRQPSYASGGNAVASGYPASLNNIAVRSTGSTTMVPSMKSGFFPPEYKNLRMTPTDAAYQPLPKESSKPKKKRKKAVSFEPLARSLQSKLLTTSQEMKRLKDRLAKTDSKVDKERAKSTRKLKLILDALEEKQVWKDQALMSAVEQLIQETLESFQDVVDEVDLLQILEEIVAQIPQPFIYEVPLPPPEPVIERSYEAPVTPAPTREPTEETYTIINVQRRPTAIIRLPEPVEKAEIEVQTEVVKEEEEEEDVPPPPPPPPVAPTVIEVTKPSVEKDLLAILTTVVDSNKAAMQGQQAIILSLVQELAEKHSEESAAPQVIVMPHPAPAPSPPKEDKVVDTSDLPLDRESAPAPAMEEVSSVSAAAAVTEVLPPAPTVPPYRTAFGDVVLGGKTLTGPYAIAPTRTLPQALAEAGLNEFGEVVVQPPLHDNKENHENQPRTKFDTPVQRRAKPLTMMLLNRPTETKSATSKPPVHHDSHFSAQMFADFATKLLDTVGQNNQSNNNNNNMTKAEVMQAVQEGVIVGVRTALGYWEDDMDDDYVQRGYRPVGNMLTHGTRKPVDRKGFPLHRILDNDDLAQNNSASAKKRALLDAEDDPLTMRNLQRERDESRLRTKKFLQEYREEVRDSSSLLAGGAAFDDLVSLAEEDEEFHALYGDRNDPMRDTVSVSTDTLESSLSVTADTTDRDKQFLRDVAAYRQNPMRKAHGHHNHYKKTPVLRSEKVSSPLADTSFVSNDSDLTDKKLEKSPSHRRHGHVKDHHHDDRDDDNHDDDFSFAEDGGSYVGQAAGGLPPLVSSVLPHHATRVARERGLYHTQHALRSPIEEETDLQSSWATSSTLSSHRGYPTDGHHRRRQRGSRELSSRFQARTKPRHSHLRSSDSGGHSSFVATEQSEDLSEPGMQRLKDLSVSVSETPTSESQHWSDDSSEASEPSKPRLVPTKKTKMTSKPHRSRTDDKKEEVDDENKRDDDDDYNDKDVDIRDDLDRSLASPYVSTNSSTSSIYSFNTSHSSIAPHQSDYIGRHVAIPLLSVGSSAAQHGKPRWNV